MAQIYDNVNTSLSKISVNIQSIQDSKFKVKHTGVTYHSTQYRVVCGLEKIWVIKTISCNIYCMYMQRI